MRRARALLPALVLAATVTPPVAQAAPTRPDPVAGGVIGIRLAEIPANRMNDPRARLFIIDHVNPGTTFTRRLQVYNSSPKPQHITLYPGAATVKDHHFTFTAGAKGNELTSWIRLNDPWLNLKPHASAPVKATIAVPTWARQGERYAVIWAQVSSAKPSPKGNITLVNQVGIRAYLHVGPGAEPPSDFTIGRVHPQRTPGRHHSIVATVTNTGQRAIDLEGRLSLTDGPSSLNAGPFPITRGTTLAPGEHGQITVPLGDDITDGPWKYHLTLQSGRVTHTVTGTLTFTEKPRMSGQLASFEHPTLILTLTAIAIAAVILLILGLRRLRTRRRTPDHKPSS
jgi:hypothetical protein